MKENTQKDSIENSGTLTEGKKLKRDVLTGHPSTEDHYSEYDVCDLVDEVFQIDCGCRGARGERGVSWKEKFPSSSTGGAQKLLGSMSRE